MEKVETIRAEDPRGFVPKIHMTFGAAERLGVFQQYRFFTPGLLYLFGKFFDQPLIQFMADINKEIYYLHHRFNQPIFSGMQSLHTDGDWNHVLWAVGAEYWPAFESFLLSIAFCDSAEKVTYRVGVQDILIPDPLWVDKHSTSNQLPPLIEIQVFGVNGSDACVAMYRRMTQYTTPVVGHFAPQHYMLKIRDRFMRHDLPGADAAIPNSLDIPLATPPIDFRTQPLSAMSPEKQQEYLAAIAEYRKTMP